MAAASILARASFIEGLNMLSDNVKKTLPKGASQKVIDIGKVLMLSKGIDIFPSICKIHFKSYQDIISNGS